MANAVLTQGHVVFELTDEDRRLMRITSLKVGTGDMIEALNHKVCIMQLVTLMTEQRFVDIKVEAEKGDMAEGLTDYPICVSEAITEYLISLNDTDTISQSQRNQLKKLIPNILNTCPIRGKVVKNGEERIMVEDRHPTREYAVAEAEREEILNDADYRDPKIPFTKKLDAVRRAAAVPN